MAEHPPGAAGPADAASAPRHPAPQRPPSKRASPELMAACRDDYLKAKARRLREEGRRARY